MLVRKYSNLSLKTPFPLLMKGAAPDNSMLVANFTLDADVSQLFPYINAVVNGSVYYDKPDYILFMLENVKCGLYPEMVYAACFEDRDQAIEFIWFLIDFLNDLYDRKGSIEPNYKRYKPPSVLDIYKLLPKTNCRECGYRTCMAFAGALSKGDTEPEQCPGFKEPVSVNAVYPVYDRDGNLESTFSIDIDYHQQKNDLEKQQRQIATLKKELAGIKNMQKQPFEDNHIDIQTDLTGRELEVLFLIAKGATNTEISHTLSISPHTVKSHVIHIFNKLGVNDRTQAAVWAAHHKLV